MRSPPSWSDPAHVTDGSGATPLLPTSAPAAQSHRHEHASDDAEFVIQGDCLSGERGGSYCELPAGHPGPDDKLAENAVSSLKMLSNYSKSSGHPFWLGVGFHKPCACAPGVWCVCLCLTTGRAV